MKQIKAPWTDEQVIALNRWQKKAGFHPFTCGGLEHPKYEETPFGQFERDRTLFARNDGWHCPTCPYTQDWAWDAMFETSPLR